MSEKKEKKNKAGFLSKVGKFFREYRSELKKISWPTFPEVLKNTGITLVVVVLIGAVIWLGDFIFGQARNVLINYEPATSATDTADITNELDGAVSLTDAQ